MQASVLPDRKVALSALAASACAFVLYAVMAARDVMFGDGPELTAAAVTNGVGHPPGYPLWIVLGHIASLLPVGPLPFRVNPTGCRVSRTCRRIGLRQCIRAQRAAMARRFLAAAFLAIGSPLFLSWSLQAEVFSLNDLFAAAVVLLSLLWLDDATLAGGLDSAARSDLFGLWDSHHQTLILLVAASFVGGVVRATRPAAREGFAC